MKKLLVASCIFILIVNLSSLNLVLAQDVTITPKTQNEMQESIYKIFENSLIARNNTFSINIDFSQYIDPKIIAITNSENEIIEFIPAQPYFDVKEPFNRFKFSDGNDYLATIFAINGNAVDGFISNGERDMQGGLTSITITYNVNWEENTNQTNQVINKIKQINSNILTNSMSSYEKVKTIHDYILNNYEYDFTYNFNPTYYLIDHNQFSCENISAFFYLLLKDAGFNTRIILKGSLSETSQALNKNGIKQAHAWNLVYLDNKWYHIDVTWDDTFNQKLKYDYFLKSDETFQIDHFWDKSNYASAATNFDFSSPPQLSTVIMKSLAPNNSTKASSSVSSQAISAISSTVSSQSTSQSTSISSKNTTPNIIKLSNTISPTKEKTDELSLILNIFIPINIAIIIIFVILIYRKIKSKDSDN